MTVDYSLVRETAEAGALIVLVPIVQADGRPGVAVFASELTRKGYRIASSPNQRVRVGQMYGAMSALRAHARAHGCTA